MFETAVVCNLLPPSVVGSLAHKYMLIHPRLINQCVFNVTFSMLLSRFVAVLRVLRFTIHVMLVLTWCGRSINMFFTLVKLVLPENTVILVLLLVSRSILWTRTNQLKLCVLSRDIDVGRTLCVITCRVCHLPGPKKMLFWDMRGIVRYRITSLRSYSLPTNPSNLRSAQSLCST
jgi:hypothetical protein